VRTHVVPASQDIRACASTLPCSTAGHTYPMPSRARRGLIRALVPAGFATRPSCVLAGRAAGQRSAAHSLRAQHATLKHYRPFCIIGDTGTPTGTCCGGCCELRSGGAWTLACSILLAGALAPPASEQLPPAQPPPLPFLPVALRERRRVSVLNLSVYFERIRPILRTLTAPRTSPPASTNPTSPPLQNVTSSASHKDAPPGTHT